MGEVNQNPELVAADVQQEVQPAEENLQAQEQMPQIQDENAARFQQILQLILSNPLLLQKLQNKGSGDELQDMLRELLEQEDENNEI